MCHPNSLSFAQQSKKLRLWQVAGMVLCGLLLMTLPAFAGSVRFAQTPALSPDGQTIAFSWRGDIWRVSKQGGNATRLTTNQGYDHLPVWSPDGKHIAFATRRHGNDDVYTMTADGNNLRAITHHSQRDYPAFWSKDGKRIFFRSRRGRVTNSRYRLYDIDAQGGMPRLTINFSSAGAALSPSGRYIAFARGSGRWWRKRWKGPFHSRLWLYDTKTQAFTQLTPQGYTADFPSWLNENELVFRSEKSGTFNLWKLNIKTKATTQLTKFSSKAIRHPMAAANGSAVVFARWDGLYMWDAKTGKTSELAINAPNDTHHNRRIRKVVKKGIRTYVVSPSGKEVAFIIRGNLYTKRLKDPHSWARPLGHSFWREREPAWSPDGKHIAFVSDRKNGTNAIYIAKAGTTKKGKTRSFSKTLLPTVTRLSAPEIVHTEHHPAWSPNGKYLAFIRGRGTLVLYHLKTKSERILYKDWNIGTYRWSPDGRWIAFERTNRHSNTDIYILSLRKGAKPFNVSRFPDYNMSPVWSANGRVLAYLSRNINNRFAIHYVYLRHTDHEKSNAERKQACKRWAKLWKRNLRKPKKRKKPTRTAKPSTAPTSRPAKVTKSTKKAKKKRKKRRGLVRITQLNRLPFRIRSVPFTPGFDGARGLAISPTGCAFVFGARGRNVSGLYRIRYDGTGLKRLAKGSFKKPTFTRKGKTFFLSRSGTLMMAGRKRAKAFRFRAEMIIDQAIAYKQKFMEGWSLLNEWFYDPTFHGAKWSQLRDEYGSLLKHITNNVDFDILSNMLLGELNASHLGMYSRYRGPRNHTGDIGAGFVPASTGKGLRVVYVRKWGPASHRKSKLYPGDVLLAIDGKPVSVRTNIYASLNHRAGRYVALTVKRRNGKVVTFAIQPVGQRQAHIQRYRTWMDGVRAKVKRLSGGALSYAHIRSMNMTSLARFERALAAHTYGTKALVIDVRNNGGGWIADLLLAMFFPKAHGYTQWRGSRKGYPMGRRPFLAWYKPSILLCNQRSVSNAEIFSHAYKNLKLGTLVGMPTYGGVISTRTLRILDKTWFRIPLRGWWALPTKKNMENGPAVPNVLVPLTPADEVNGRDPQLRKSIQLLMKQLAAKQAKK